MWSMIISAFCIGIVLGFFIGNRINDDYICKLGGMNDSLMHELNMEKARNVKLLLENKELKEGKSGTEKNEENSGD